MSITTAGDCKLIVQEIIASRNNSNHILKLEELLLSKCVDTIQSSIESVRILFVHFLEAGEIIHNAGTTEEENVTDQSPEEKYMQWLSDRYEEFKQHLLAYLSHRKKKIQIDALNTLMAFIVAEVASPLKSLKGVPHPPKNFVQVVVQALLNIQSDIHHLLKHFHSHLNDVIKFHVLRSLPVIILKTPIKNEQFCLNAFSLLKCVPFPETLTDSNAGSQHGDDNVFVISKKTFTKTFSRAWVEYLKCKIPEFLYKNLINYLTTKVVSYLNDPLVLTDFLTDAYSIDGIVSLLALKGIFFLMQNYNLEYADFYKKLYSLFTVEVVTSKYNDRFFYLADLFLSSTYLPSYLAAAFAKRLSRLCLHVPPQIILIILPLIGNLLIRHPTVLILINSSDQTEIMTDPYVFDEQDFIKSNALKSSLWEVKSLQNHWHPDVSKAAHFIDKKQPEYEWTISDYLELSIDDLMHKEVDDCISEVPMSFDTPSGIFLRKEDVMHDLWTL